MERRSGDFRVERVGERPFCIGMDRVVRKKYQLIDCRKSVV